MKKLLLLLFIPMISFSQTYNELMSIEGLDDFKKVMIENKYEFEKIYEDGSWMYGFNMTRDSVKGNGSEKWGTFYKDEGWRILFNKRNTIIYQLGDYDEIVKNIKDKCSYVGIEKFYKNNDYVSYRCEDSKFDGKIGFMISEGSGFIRYFPKNP